MKLTIFGCIATCSFVLFSANAMPQLVFDGINVVPHVQSSEMRYRRDPDFSLGARVNVFLRNSSAAAIDIPASTEIRLRGRSPEELLKSDEWAWHDLPSAWGGEALHLPPNAMTVWSWNGKRAAWGSGTEAELAITLSGRSEAERLSVRIDNPAIWLSAVTFLGSTNNIQPEALMFHLVNRTAGSLKIAACRLWLPENNDSWRTLIAQPWISNRLECFPGNGIIPTRDRGGARVVTGPLPLTYVAIEVRLIDSDGKAVTVWAYQRIKREVFDISGGWLAGDLHGSNTLQVEPFLKTLRRMHVNAGMHQEVPGYTDTALFEKYPLKYMNRLQPFDHYDTDKILPRVHAVEFMGEPQYGGGRPVPPMEVWRAFAPYQSTRLPTSVTHSEERVWRYYAGLSDYPHFDAYRVTAPSPDAWSKYERWGGQTIRWGAPLETIGEMTRSLRELNRPRPIAYWSQGAHDGWDVYGGRKRTSPTPDELRLQAYHALASRITSLYWFNLSLKSLAAFPDLIEPIARVGREIRMLDDYYLEGDATSHERIFHDGQPQWDLDVVSGPRGALLFALDLAYAPDPQDRVFKFGRSRETTFQFPLPSYLRTSADVFRVDADGVTPVEYSVSQSGMTIRDQVSRIAIYVVAMAKGERSRLEARHQALLADEKSLEFDPGGRSQDLAVLQDLVGRK